MIGDSSAPKTSPKTEVADKHLQEKAQEQGVRDSQDIQEVREDLHQLTQPEQKVEASFDSEKYNALRDNIDRYTDQYSMESKEERQARLSQIREEMGQFDKAIEDEELLPEVLQSINSLAESEAGAFLNDETNVATEFVRRHLDVITERINRGNEGPLSDAELDTRLECFRSLLNYAEIEENYDMTRLNGNLDIVAEGLGRNLSYFQEPGLIKISQRLLDNYFDYETTEQPEQYKLIFNALKDRINRGNADGSKFEKCANIVNGLKKGDGSRQAGSDLMRVFLGENGFSADLVSSWIRADLDPRQIEENLLSVETLEKERPGIVNALNSEFGITLFGFYSKDVLVDQFDNRDNLETPYGIYLSARADGSGVFQTTREPIEKLAGEIKGKSHLRIVEAGSRLEVAKSLVRLDRKYGSSNKIQFAVITGHGQKEDIQFGPRWRKGSLLTIQDLQGEGTKRSGEFFVDHPTIILVSCSTGQEGGIAQEISEKLGADVIAPDSLARIRSIDVDFASGEPKFDASYFTFIYQDLILRP